VTLASQATKSASRTDSRAQDVEAMQAVEAVEQVLIRHARVLYGAFDHYSFISHYRETDSTLLDVQGHKIGRLREAIANHTLDLHSVSKPGFYQFVEDCEIEGSNCSFQDVKNIISAVNAEDHETANIDVHNSRSILNRHEWLQAIVRLSVRMKCRYDSKTGVFSGSVADAVDSLCSDNLLGKLPREALENANTFRKAHCYTAETDKMLKKHRETLRALFSCYTALDSSGCVDDETRLVDGRLMSVGEWLEFVVDIGLIEMELIDIKMALQVFLWSRIRSIGDYSNRAEISLRHFRFEDFLEGLVRLATVMAMPTPGELDEAGCSGAAEFLHALRRDEPIAYREHAQRRTLNWLEKPHQRTHVLVGHLIDLILHNVGASLAASEQTKDEPGPQTKRMTKPLSPSEAGRFCQHRIAGSALSAGKLSVHGSELVSAMQRVEGHIMDALRQVPAFDCLHEAQLLTLREALAVAKFEDGERVFDQGDEGDAFYLITTGHADVLRYDPACAVGERGGEERIARLHPSDCFGERALLFNEPRAASIRAGPGCRLYVVFITRGDFEKALGKPLEEFKQLSLVTSRAHIEVHP